MTWAVYERDVPIMLAVLSILVWRTTAWWRSRALGEWRGTPTTHRGGSTKLGFITEECNGTHRWRVGKAKETTDKAYGAKKNSQGRRNSQPARISETNGGEESRTQRDQANKETRGTCSSLCLMYWRARQRSPWKSEATNRHAKLENERMYRGEDLRTSCVTGGTEGSINNNGLPDGPGTSSLNTRKLMRGPKTGAKGRVGRMGGHCPCCVVRGHWSLWVL